MKGIKHLIECHCILPQYRYATTIVYHKFVVFSIIDDSDTVIPKFVQCNNCDVIHKVFDICKSEIIAGRDELRSVTTIDEICNMLSENIVETLKSYDVDLATYENVKFILDNKKWGDHVVLARDNVNDETTGKILVFNAENSLRIEPFINRSMIDASK